MTLEASRAQLRPVCFPERDSEMAVWLQQRREPEHCAADAACEEFALKESWPPIRNDDVMAQVHLRVLGAAHLCRSLVQKPLPRGLSRRQVLRALLLDYWHSRVAHWKGESNPTAPASVVPLEHGADLWSGHPVGRSNLTLSE